MTSCCLLLSTINSFYRLLLSRKGIQFKILRWDVWFSRTRLCGFLKPAGSHALTGKSLRVPVTNHGHLKSRIGEFFLLPAHLGCPRKRAIKWLQLLVKYFFCYLVEMMKQIIINNKHPSQCGSSLLSGLSSGWLRAVKGSKFEIGEQVLIHAKCHWHRSAQQSRSLTVLKSWYRWMHR